MIEFLHRLKLLSQTALPVSGDTVLVWLGLACYLATCLISRRALTWAWALVPGFLISVAIEGLEIWDHYGPQGLNKAGARGLTGIVLRHARDVAVMNAAPAIVFLVAILIERAGHR